MNLYRFGVAITFAISLGCVASSADSLCPEGSTIELNLGKVAENNNEIAVNIKDSKPPKKLNLIDDTGLASLFFLIALNRDHSAKDLNFENMPFLEATKRSISTFDHLLLTRSNGMSAKEKKGWISAREALRRFKKQIDESQLSAAHLNEVLQVMLPYEQQATYKTSSSSGESEKEPSEQSLQDILAESRFGKSTLYERLFPKNGPQPRYLCTLTVTETPHQDSGNNGHSSHVPASK